MTLLRRARAIGVACLAMCSLACASGSIQLGSPVSENYDTSRSRVIETGACGFMLLALIPFRVASSLERAHADLLKQARGDYVTNIRIGTHWIYAFVGTVHCTDIEGTAYSRN